MIRKARIPVYKVSLGNGRFDHVEGKNAARRQAARMLGLTRAEARDFLSLDDDQRHSHWGVSVERISETEARAVGMRA